jgi:hypothetical protein
MSADAVGWVYRHSPYSGVAFQVHHAVADSVNDQHGNEFWMTKPNLAIKARTSVASAKRAMEAMVADGYLDLLEESGGRDGSRYRFLFPDVPVIYDSRSTGSPRTGSPGRANRLTTRAQPAHQDAPTGSPGTENASHKEGSQRDPKENPNQPKADVAFETFWSIYPRKEKKGDARKAWLVATRKASIGIITAGAIRYRDDPNRDPAYTAHPTSWLNAERWTDDPLPPRSSGPARGVPRGPAPIDDDRAGPSRLIRSEDL